jgi:hypothetical protein
LEVARCGFDEGRWVVVRSKKSDLLREENKAPSIVYIAVSKVSATYLLVLQ